MYCCSTFFSNLILGRWSFYSIPSEKFGSIQLNPFQVSSIGFDKTINVYITWRIDNQSLVVRRIDIENLSTAFFLVRFSTPLTVIWMQFLDNLHSNTYLIRLLSNRCLSNTSLHFALLCYALLASTMFNSLKKYATQCHIIHKSRMKANKTACGQCVRCSWCKSKE